MTLQTKLDRFWDSRYYWPSMLVVLGLMVILFVGIAF